MRWRFCYRKTGDSACRDCWDKEFLAADLRG
jgi:hypothetical protein